MFCIYTSIICSLEKLMPEKNKIAHWRGWRLTCMTKHTAFCLVDTEDWQTFNDLVSAGSWNQCLLEDFYTTVVDSQSTGGKQRASHC